MTGSYLLFSPLEPKRLQLLYQTLRKSTAAMLRSGARPVAVSPTPQGLDLVWETLTEDLTAVQAGKLSIVVNEEPPGLRWCT